MTTRRNFLSLPLAAYAAPPDGPWAALPAILGRIRPPSFPHRDFPITRYGAQPGDASGGIRKAIGACAAAGGGRVVVPPGKFLTGPIHLKSRVNLHLAEGATLLFRREPEAYLPAVFTRWEGMECMNFSPFIYAFGQSDIAITGAGTLDGNSAHDAWWPWKGRRQYGWTQGEPHQEPARARLMQMIEEDVPVEKRVFGPGDYLRPQFIQPYKCQNVLVEGVTIVRSPMWEIHPVLCRNVTVRKVNIVTHGPNNDGCNPESSADVLIEGCGFDTGDDCIAIKSGRNRDGRRINAPSENIVIRNCRMKDGHGGVTIGSEASGGVRNVFAEDCRMDSPRLERALRFKTNAVRGGVIENVCMRRVTIGEVSGAVIDADFHYEEGARGTFLPTLRGILVQDVTSAKSRYALFLRAFKNAPITGLTLERCTFDDVKEPNRIEHVQGVVFRDVRINGSPAAAPPAA
jgi:polygalacturonase